MNGKLTGVISVAACAALCVVGLTACGDTTPKSKVTEERWNENMTTAITQTYHLLEDGPDGSMEIKGDYSRHTLWVFPSGDSFRETYYVHEGEQFYIYENSGFQVERRTVSQSEFLSLSEPYASIAQTLTFSLEDKFSAFTRTEAYEITSDGVAVLIERFVSENFVYEGFGTAEKVEVTFHNGNIDTLEVYGLSKNGDSSETLRYTISAFGKAEIIVPDSYIEAEA